MQGSVKMRFDSPTTQIIYFGWTPDDTTGSQFGMGWAAMYARLTAPDEISAVVLHYTREGGMVRELPGELETYEDLWLRLVDQYEFTGDPDDDAIVISHEGPGEFCVTPQGSTYSTEGEAVRNILDAWEDPDIWFCNRRGNFHLMTDEEVQRLATS